MDTFRLLQRLIPTILPFLLILVLEAQDNLAPVPAPVELKISRVDILYEGPQSVSQAYIRANIHLAKDGVFTDTRLDQSIRSLYRTGLFEYVEASVEKTGEKEIAVSLKVRPKFRILEILFRGNEKI
ncbi:MAG: hypothetical protein OSA95_07255, partial [Opitutales bacterium]|nr:hypothetical protein [Opitutales bacterium]